ncbi:hypothetical protein [Streptomyces sp. 8N706]|uniref:hypothetical protein n=1 Tax=Streptomyces sp. 8N706 TaxID=3457416 RepID=UPI003FD3BBE4
MTVFAGPGAERPGKAGFLGAELEGATLEPVRAGDHRVPASSWVGMPLVQFLHIGDVVVEGARADA